MILFYTIVGALWRRWFGGWNPLRSFGLELKKPHKLFINYALAYVMGFLLFNDLLFGLVVAPIAIAIAHPNGHGWGMAMGNWNPNGTLPTHVCIAIFLGNYGIAMAATGLLWNLIYHSQAGYFYAAMGLLCWVPHWAAQHVIKPLCQKIGFIGWEGKNLFIGEVSDPVPFGELGLGALLYGGLPMAYWISAEVVK